MNAAEPAGEGGPGVSATGTVMALIVAAGVVAGVYFALRTDTTGRAGNRLPKEFQPDFSSFRRIDPNLFKYEQAARFRTAFDRVFAIATGPDDSIYVAGDRAVGVFDPDGRPTGRTAIDGQARCLAVAAGGTMYVGIENRVVVYSPDGAVVRAWGPGGAEAVVTGIALSGDDVFVATYRRRTGAVWRYDATGKLIGRIGPKGDGGDDKKIGPFVVPSAYFDLAVAPDGLLRVAHTGKRSIEAYTFDGDREFAWGRSCAGIEGFSGCCNPAHLAILPDGSIVTSEKGPLRSVKVYRPDGPGDPNGALEGVLLSGDPGKPGAVWDVAADSRGRILVLDRERRAVLVFVRKEKL